MTNTSKNFFISLNIIKFTLIILPVVYFVYSFRYFDRFIIYQKTPIIPFPAKVIPDECKINCDSEYGIIIGMFSNVPAFSNCGNGCSNFDDPGVILYKNQTDFYQDVYTGMRWQCVEYSRRYLVINKGVTFDNVESAYQIFDIVSLTKILTKEEYENGNGDKQYEFVKYENGNKEAPLPDDLIIFPKRDDAPHGHVAVINKVDIEDGYIEIAEQNNDNKLWKYKDFSRRLAMHKDKNEKYFIFDVEIELENSKNNIKYESFKEFTQTHDTKSVIGWKRIGKELQN